MIKDASKNMKIQHAPRNITILLLIFAGITFSGCSEREQKVREIELPPTSVLRDESTFAVVNSSHLRLRSEPTTSSKVVATLWRGYVLEIIAKQSNQEVIEGEEDYWYQIQYDGLNGWVFGAYLDLYNSRPRAEEAAEKLK